MIYINDQAFYDIPGSCGTCGFFYDGGSSLCPTMGKGHCLMFDEMHHSWCEPPRRCKKIFRNAFRHPEGARLTIVKTNGKESD